MIVVLTMGRSGSSLMMQTLKLLGADVFGYTFRKNPTDAHFALNPKGYFEDGRLYARGLKSEAFRRLQAQGNPKIAFKTDVLNFVESDAIELWQGAIHQITCVLVSIRIPCEQARSEFLGTDVHPMPDGSMPSAKLAEFQFSTEFLQNYRQNFQTLERHIEGPLSCYGDRLHAIDYAQARIDPDRYVRRVATCAKLTPTDTEIEQAIDNIEEGLYRNKADDLSETQGHWAQRLGAQKVYEELRMRFP
ncbi:hypothetical protein [Planktotalea sp.]|uniref:hypothetical protein n=1 Tax=Planktotalea sp. TaxID=2029877 RepID=UPI003D6A88F3